MKWLQKNHKRNAVILESALVILVLYFRVFCKVKPDTITVMLSFGVLTANVLVYWLWGLPSAAMTMTYTLLFTVSVAAGVVLTLYVPLPDFLGEGIWIAPITGVDCFFIAGINLPQIVKTSMEAKLEIIKEDSVYDMEEGEKNEIEEKTTYNVYIQLRDIENIRRNPGKSYSLGNVSKPNFWFRIIVGGIVFIFSLFSFLIGSNGEDQALTIWNSWVFWTFVGGLSGMIIATAILLAGFLRALITAAVCVICLGVGIGFYYILSYIHTVSILLFSILLVCIILLIITVYVEILKRLSQKRPSGMEYYKAEEGLIGVELSLKNAMPIVEYESVIKISGMVKAPWTEKDLYHFMYQLENFSFRTKLIPMGIRWNQSECRKEIYILVSSVPKAYRKLRFFLYRNKMNDECMELLPDTPEKIYNDLLYPSEEKIAEIATNAKLQFLRENNFDFNESYPVVFCSSFRDKQGAEAYIGHIKKLYNLERCVIYDHTDSESEDDLPLSYPIGAYFQVSEVLTRELLCIQCSVIIRIADKYGGKFDIWELGEIQEGEDVGN